MNIGFEMWLGSATAVTVGGWAKLKNVGLEIKYAGMRVVGSIM